jgi:CBS domain-containing protein
MSPRAAWRLEALRYGEVYDCAAGKSDWMAGVLRTEGNVAGRPRVADVMDPAPATCSPAEPVAEVVARVAPTEAQLCVVVNEGGVVRGRLRFDRVDPGDARPAEEVMERPTTVRADADPAETIERMRRRGATSLIVSTPDGVLLGVVHGGPVGSKRAKSNSRIEPTPEASNSST